MACQKAITICRGLSHLTRSLSITVCRGQKCPKGRKGTLSTHFQANTTLWKKPFCFSFPPENSRIKDRKSRFRYQNNLPAAHRVFLNYPCQKATAGKFRPETTDTAKKSRPSGARKGKARKSRQVKQIRPENSAASNCSYGRKIPASNYWYGRKIRLL